MERRLYRSRTDSKLAGVCGGLGQFFGIDSTVIRLTFVLLALFGGHTILLYLIMMLVVPPEPERPVEPAGNVSK
jgi:phage shock protein PspC (stress-responsive transcriptional regulator)